MPDTTTQQEREAFDRANLRDAFGEVPTFRERELMFKAWQVRATLPQRDEPAAEGKAAMDAYELVILHANLDEIGAPKDIDGKVLSPWGRVKEHPRVLTTPPSPSLGDIELAKMFHDIYEELAPNFGYETRHGTRSWAHDSPNGALMVEVVRRIRRHLAPSPSLREVQADALALRSEALDIFDGPECPQSVRDAIEWYDSSLRVLLARLEWGNQ